MRKYARIARRRVEAAFKLRIDRTHKQHPIEPRMDEPLGEIPTEVVDLATGPFQRRFPELSGGNRDR